MEAHGAFLGQTLRRWSSPSCGGHPGLLAAGAAHEVAWAVSATCVRLYSPSTRLRGC